MTAIRFTARNTTDASGASTACAVVPVFSGKILSSAAQETDRASGGAVSAALKLGDFTAAGGESLMLAGAGKARRVLLVGCGNKKKFDRKAALEFI